MKMIREIVAQVQSVTPAHHNHFAHLKLYAQSALSIILTSVTFTNAETIIRVSAGLAAFVLSCFTIYKLYLDIKIRRNILNGKGKPTDAP